jgi:hypothetical protein
MKNNFWILLSLQIMAVFITAMIVSFIPEKFNTFFGDWICDIREFHYGDKWASAHTHWGYRHFLFFFMGSALFIVQVATIITFINKATKNSTN